MADLALTRRQFLRGATLVGGALLVGCQPPTAGPPTGAGLPARTGAPWEREWDELVAAAKREGTLVLSGPPTPAVREDLPRAFRSSFGVEIEYLGGRTGDLMTRIEAERAAGQYTVDALVSGAQTLYLRAYPQGMLAPIGDLLVHPEATDPTKWVTGKPWFSDPDGKYILRLSNQVTTVVATGEQFVKASDIRAWRDLLDPRYRGRISVYDPTVSGTGQNTAVFLLRSFGDDYVRTVYRDQQPGVSRDERQLADWLVRGTYPVTLGLGAAELEPLRADGFEVGVSANLPDATGLVTAGFGQLAVFDPAPHPSAAKLFANWMAMKEGSEVYNRTQVNVSTRTDVINAWAPDYSIPKPGLQYLDAFDWNYVQEARNPEEVERIKRLTGL